MTDRGDIASRSARLGRRTAVIRVLRAHGCEYPTSEVNAISAALMCAARDGNRRTVYDALVLWGLIDPVGDADPPGERGPVAELITDLISTVNGAAT